MSKRATDFAFNKFPFRYDAHGDVIDFEQTVVLQGVCRIGYMQAEKDLALTVADIERIHVFLYAVKNNKQGAFTFTRLKDEQYQEVLEKFNKTKEE